MLPLSTHRKPRRKPRRAAFCSAKRLIAAALLAGCAALAHPQDERPRLAVLPLGGGIAGEGETIAAEISEARELRAAFAVVPLSVEAIAAAAEHRLQMGAFTDSDLAAGVGRMLGADYVLSGSLRRLGNRNLIVVTVVCAGTLQLVAGYHRTYRNIHEARGFLPAMAASLAEAVLARPAPGSLPTLAIAPLDANVDPATLPRDHPPDALAHDTETLTQILAIELAAAGRHAVLPRASAMQTALRAWETRVADERAAALDVLLGVILGILDEQEDVETGETAASVTEVGRAAAAEYVLSVETRRLDGATIFAAQVIGTESAATVAGADRGHASIGGGVSQMAEIAILLTDPEGAPERIARRARQERRAAMFGDPARFWSAGVFAGTSFADPLVIATLQGTLAPLPFSFVRLGVDLGLVSEMDGVSYHSIYPFAHLALFVPFALTPVPLRRGGAYLGVGGGFLTATYAFPHDLDKRVRMPLMDFAAGVNIADAIGISYTLRTDFASFNSKVSAGFTRRFWTGRR